MQKIQLALTQEWASSRGPSPTVRPSDYQMIGQRFLLLSHQFGFCRLFWGLSSSLRAFGLSRARERSFSPNPRSINQTKALLDKLSPRASRNQYSQSISQATATTPCQHPTLSPSSSTTEPFPLHCRAARPKCNGGAPPHNA